jgi:hypothetical protein
MFECPQSAARRQEGSLFRNVGLLAKRWAAALIRSRRRHVPTLAHLCAGFSLAIPRPGSRCRAQSRRHTGSPGTASTPPPNCHSDPGIAMGRSRWDCHCTACRPKVSLRLIERSVSGHQALVLDTRNDEHRSLSCRRNRGRAADEAQRRGASRMPVLQPAASLPAFGLYIPSGPRRRVCRLPLLSTLDLGRQIIAWR